MEKLIEIYNKVNAFGRENNLELNIDSPGKITYKMTVEQKHLATPTAIHGGMLAAYMDAILGVAGLSAVAEEGKLVSTVEFKINFFKPAFLGDELIGKGTIEKKGNRILFAAGEITNQNNETVAKGSGTLNAYPFEKSDVAEYINKAN